MPYKAGMYFEWEKLHKANINPLKIDSSGLSFNI